MILFTDKLELKKKIKPKQITKILFGSKKKNLKNSHQV